MTTTNLEGHHGHLHLTVGLQIEAEDHLCMTAHLKGHHGHLHLTVGLQISEDEDHLCVTAMLTWKVTTATSIWLSASKYRKMMITSVWLLTWKATTATSIWLSASKYRKMKITSVWLQCSPERPPRPPPSDCRPTNTGKWRSPLYDCY